MTDYSAIQVASLGAVGALVSGIDLADCSDDALAELRRAYADHSVLFFRDQEIDVDDHKRIARHFGDIFVHPNFNTGEQRSHQTAASTACAPRHPASGHEKR